MNMPRGGITVDRDVKLECKVQNSANANDSPPNSSPIILKPLLLSKSQFLLNRFTCLMFLLICSSS